ncbi:diguanylate cyclase [Sulfurirhabdus autotrophica]|uniref:diguanylate cyclase n=1 Tax=Sulfurirhabdus autotrophica TaxID=1706046 RepID=A0A4R3Y0E5_9PROT|nr:diguanylate cyclase [Sulfurirhabdus autotrophica]TCV84088.1 response regulator receiver modulated diguanylate cyclase [Sulfurirhabdus autotrophica]
MKKKLTAGMVSEQLAKLRNDYLIRLPAELIALNSLAAGLSEGENKRESLEELQHRLHKLAGSGGTFGFAALSARARNLEQQTKGLLAGSLDDIDRQTRLAFAAYVAGLGETMAAVDLPKAAVIAANIDKVPGQSYNIWLMEKDAFLGNELLRQLESFNYKVRLFVGIEDVVQAAQHEQPDMLLLDVQLEQKGENASSFTLPQVLLNLESPLLFISSSGDFMSRVRASQLGAEGYFTKPLDIPLLVNRMQHIFEQRLTSPQRVLIVDDDVELAAYYRLVLQGAGMEAAVLHQPEAIIEKIKSFRPELVLLDLRMPVYSGPDLAGVIRQHDNLASLPLVYLSAETDLASQIAAMDRGADDFLVKPISDAQLIAAVSVRIARARQLGAQIAKDSLTGLLKHGSIKEALDIEVIRARRSSKPVTVAMLDIDSFKSVNDNYGHATGDVVISSTAMLLRQRLRQSDIIGRYGGEEFVVVLPECDADNAYMLLDDIRQRFAALRFSHEGKNFTCALSAGLACSEQHPDSNGSELLIAADVALYAAKRGGRNQVRVAQRAGEVMNPEE